MIVTFNTQNQDEVNEVVDLLQNMGMEHVGVMPETKTPPQRKAKASKTEKESPVISTQLEEVSEAPEPSEKQVEKAPTLSELKDIAKAMVTKTDRMTVKNCIGKYGDKLTDVQESDYAALKADLEALA